MLGSFGFEAIHGCLEDLCIFIDLRLVFRAEFVVDFIPVLGVLRFVWFLLPSGNVPLDEVSPYLCVCTTKLRRCFLEFSLHHSLAVSLVEHSALETYQLVWILKFDEYRTDKFVWYVSNVRNSCTHMSSLRQSSVLVLTFDIFGAGLPGKVVEG